MNFPKVLIIGPIFNNYTGGGITLTNLFLNWPRENIAIISWIENDNWSICGLQYLVGRDETSKLWPFSLLQDRRTSAIIKKEENATLNDNVKIATQNKKEFTSRQIFRNLIKRVLSFAGIFQFFSKIKLSESLARFIDGFQPDIIYTFLGSHDLIRLVETIHERKHIPIAIHIMDDWPVTVNKSGLLGFYWNWETNRAFKTLIDKSSVHLSISDAMSIEYGRRYGKTWHAFHNPLDETFMKTDENYVSDFVYNSNRILYLGRIGIANKESIIFIIHTVIDLSLKIKDIEFMIYTKDYMINELTMFSGNKYIKILPDVPHRNVPSILKSAGALILPLDFSKYSQKYARFSMPTKTTEYMASGVPVLIFAPTENAVTKYARNEKWGFVVDKKDKNRLEQGIVELLTNQELRISLVTSALNIVIKNHNDENIREKFRETLSLAINGRKYEDKNKSSGLNSNDFV